VLSIAGNINEYEKRAKPRLEAEAIAIAADLRYIRFVLSDLKELLVVMMARSFPFRTPAVRTDIVHCLLLPDLPRCKRQISAGRPSNPYEGVLWLGSSIKSSGQFSVQDGYRGIVGDDS
jgi:hypothetical protein